MSPFIDKSKNENSEAKVNASVYQSDEVYSLTTTSKVFYNVGHIWLINEA